MGKLKPGIGALIVLAGMAGCKLFQPSLTLDYQINPSVMAQGSPQPAGVAAVSSPEMASHPEIKVKPENAEGYDTLTPEIKNLYGPDPHPVSIQNVVEQTLRHNRDIKIEGFSFQADQYQIPIAKSIYDLILEANALASKVKRQTGTSLSSASRRDRNYGVAATQLVPTGGAVELAYAMTRVDQAFAFSRLNPTIIQAITLTFTQPLLQGFGPKVTNADIHIAQLGQRSSAARFEVTIQDQVQVALDAYWDLIFAVKSYTVQVISYLAARELLRQNEFKFKFGTIAQTEVLQAKASVEERREQVILVRQSVRDSQDLLKLLIFFQDDSPAWDLELIPTQELNWREIEIDGDQVLAEALAERPELRASEAQIRIADYEVIKAKDTIKPRLDLIGSAGLTGLSDGGTQAFDELETADFNNFSIEARLRYPFQNRRARFTYRQRVTEREGVVETYEKTRDDVIFDVRIAVRELRTSRDRIDISLERVTSETANLEDELKRYQVGLSTLFEVLDFQEDVAAAQESYIRAIVDYNKATIAVERARGTILTTYGIIIDEPDLRIEDEKVLFPVGFN